MKRLRLSRKYQRGKEIIMRHIHRIWLVKRIYGLLHLAVVGLSSQGFYSVSSFHLGTGIYGVKKSGVALAFMSKNEESKPKNLHFTVEDMWQGTRRDEAHMAT